MRKRIVLLSFLVLVLVASCALAVACNKTEKFTVTWDLRENVESVNITGYDYAKTMEIEKDTEVSFTVTFAAGYEANTVKVGNKNITPSSDGTYKFTVSQDITVSITARKILNEITVELADADKVFYAGDVVEPEDIVVTAYYADDTHETVTGATISYKDNNAAFALGDTSFTVSYMGKSKVVELDYTIVGMIILNLDGGTLSQTPAGFTKVNDSLYTYEFTSALTEDMALPVPTRTINGVDCAFVRWSGVEDNTVPAGTDTNVTAIAMYNIRLVEISHMEFTAKEGVPYLEISGILVAVDSAYLYFYEGNAPAVKYDPEVSIEKKDGSNEFTIQLNLADLATATPVYGGEGEYDGSQGNLATSLMGKWLDIRFAAMYEGQLLQQELILQPDDDYADLNDEVIAKVGEDYYRFYYETWTPSKGDYITGGNGAQFTGAESILKLHYEKTTDLYRVDGVALEDKDDTVYLVISGSYLGVAEGEDELQAVVSAIYVDLMNNDGATGGGWGVYVNNGDQIVEVDSSDNTFKIYLSLKDIPSGLSAFSHFGGSGTNLTRKIDESTLTIGTITYTLKNWTGWGSQLVCVFVEDTTYANNKAVILENGKPYFVFMGDAAGKTADEIKAMLTFDFEDETNASNKIYIDADKIIVTVDNDIYTVKVDVSDVPVGRYWMHAVGLVDGNGDISADASKPGVTVDGKLYHGIDDPRNGWTAHLFEVKEVGDDEPETPVEPEVDDAAQYTVTYTELTEQDGKVVLIVKGTVVGHVEGKVVYIATVRNGNGDNNWENVKRYADVKMTVDADGNFVVTWDLTNLAVGSQYYIHFGAHEQDLPCKTVNTDKLEVTIGGIKYSIVEYNRDDNGSPQIKVAEVGAPSLSYTGATLEQKNDRAVLVLTATFENYTEAELKTIQYYETKEGMVLGVKDVEISGNTVTLYFDFTDVEVIKDWWWGHWSINGTEMGDIKCPVTTNEFVIGGRKYQLDTQWDMPIIIISEV